MDGLNVWCDGCGRHSDLPMYIGSTCVVCGGTFYVYDPNNANLST